MYCFAKSCFYYLQWIRRRYLLDFKYFMNYVKSGTYISSWSKNDQYFPQTPFEYRVERIYKIQNSVFLRNLYVVQATFNVHLVAFCIYNHCQIGITGEKSLKAACEICMSRRYTKMALGDCENIVTFIVFFSVEKLSTNYFWKLELSCTNSVTKKIYNIFTLVFIKSILAVLSVSCWTRIYFFN